MTTVGGKRQEKRKRIMSYFINVAIELMEKRRDRESDDQKSRRAGKVQQCNTISLFFQSGRIGIIRQCEMSG